MHPNENPVKVYFRFMGLNKMQAFTLRKEIMDASFEELNDNAFVGFAPLTQSSIHDINDFFVRQMINVDDCDILVRANNKGGAELIRVPKVVNQMLKYIDCELRFCFGELKEI